MNHGFDASVFMPHGHCYLWTPSILWMHVGSDILIALSYFSIPVAVSYYLLKSEHTGKLQNWIGILFVTFITLCGLTHAMDVWTTWNPNYWSEGVLKVLTAIVSVITALALWPLIPLALKIPTPESLNKANQLLKDLNKNLEGKVTTRTQESERKAAELQATNSRLRSFQDITIGREEQMIELKKEINALCTKLGEPSRYEIPKT